MLAMILSALLAAQVLMPVQAGQEGGAAKLPETEAGRRVAAYFKAFNSGEEAAMRAYFEANVSPELLQKRPVEKRLEVYRQMREEFGGLEARRVAAASETEIKLLARTAKGAWLEMVFRFEAQPPHRFFGLRAEDAEAPAGEATAPTPTPPAAAAAKMSEAEAVASIEKLVDGLVKADNFSGSVLVAKGGKSVFGRAYGLASREHGAANRLDTKFNLGSINKVFTQIAVGQLIQQGKLSLDDKLGKHLADYPNRDAAEKVTIRHLLSMTSGVGDFFGAKFDATPKDRLRKVADFLPLFASEPLRFEPGARREYSNGGYIVLGAVVEKVSGRDYYDYVRENIFRPAGMSNTDWYEADASVPNLAEGYTREGAPASAARVKNVYTRPAKGSPAGGGYSTAEDLLKFAAALESGKLRIPDSGPPQGAPGAPNVEVKGGQPAGFRGLGIAGGAPGINAILMVNPTTGYTVIVMSNYDPPSAESLGRQIRDLLTRVGT